MTKLFRFEYMGQDEQIHQSQEYPTYEEAVENRKELIDQGYQVAEIETLRV